MTPYPYPIGARVRGADVAGKPFEGEITAALGPYTVAVDHVVTPVGLIREVVTMPGKEPGIEADADPMRSATCTDNSPDDLGSWEDEIAARAAT